MKPFADTCHTPWGDLNAVTRLLSAAEAKRIDLGVAADGAVSLLQLMEQAGLVAAGWAERILPEGYPIIILAGAGQNGGDGWVAARVLAARGYALTVIDFAVERQLPQEAALNRAAAKAAGIRIERPDVFMAWPADRPALIMDALFGSGFLADRGMPPVCADAISKANRLGREGSVVLAIDLPSGVEATTGKASDPSIRAELAVSFVRPKIGQIAHPGVLHQHRIESDPLGITSEKIKALLSDMGPAACLMTDRATAMLLQPFQRDRHKGQGGKAGLIGGHETMPGAVVLAARAMAMTGVGYVSVLASERLRSDLLTVLPEALQPAGHDPSWLKNQDAIVYGPGLGDLETVSLTEVIATAKQLVIDADGLNRLARLPGWKEALAARKMPAVLTPHVGEFKRLAAYWDDDRTAGARQLALETGCIVVLKGMSTVTAAPDGQAVLNPTGNPGLAKGGSGDVLSGMIGGFLAGGMLPFQAAAAGVYVHGKAADMAAQEKGERALLPQDVIEFMPRVFRSLG